MTSPAPPPPSLERLKLAVASGALRAVMGLLGATWRMEVVVGQGVVESLRAVRRPVVFVHWHNRLVGLVYELARRFVRRGHPITVLASRSGDGELGARIARAWGGEVVRGSASRGGTEGLRHLHRALTRRRSSVVVIPDGPRGPVYRAKPGAVVLAQLSRAPLLPISFVADRAWVLRSWDGLIVPKPFARVSMAYGEPWEVPQDLDEPGLERERRRLEVELAELADRLGAAVGRGTPAVAESTAHQEEEERT